MVARTYADEDLAQAVAESRSWRGVLRHLGLRATSAGAARSVRRRAEQLGLDHSHFTGQRRWNEHDLEAAISGSRTWTEVMDKLGLAMGSSSAAVRGHALRLGIDVDHLGRRTVETVDPTRFRPDLVNLSRAGSMVAAMWFALSGYDVSWPLEPCRYDLAVRRSGSFSRVQVKTCSTKRDGLWQVSLSTSGHPTGGRHRRSVYDPDDIDCFFIITGDLECFHIPIAAVGGLGMISTSAYGRFRVGRVELS